MHPITRSLLPLLPFNTKAPYLHTLSVFYQGTKLTQRNGKVIVHSAPFGIIDCTSYIGQNYHTNTIVIVHLATLAGDVDEKAKGDWPLTSYLWAHTKSFMSIKDSWASFIFHVRWRQRASGSSSCSKQCNGRDLSDYRRRFEQSLTS